MHINDLLIASISAVVSEHLADVASLSCRVSHDNRSYNQYLR